MDDLQTRKAAVALLRVTVPSLPQRALVAPSEGGRVLRPGCGIQVLPPVLLQVLCVILVQSVSYSLYVSFPSLLLGGLTLPLPMPPF